MENDDSSNEIAQEIEIIVAEDVTPNGIVDD